MIVWPIKCLLPDPNRIQCRSWQGDQSLALATSDCREVSAIALKAACLGRTDFKVYPHATSRSSPEISLFVGLASFCA